MFQLQAPHPGLQTTTVLPSPKFGDSESLRAEVITKRAMDGTRYTYVKRKGGRKLQWTFKVTRNKGLELRAFIQSYFASTIQATDHTGRVWVGKFVNNPFEFDTPSRGGPAIAPMPRGEVQTITIEFEGEFQRLVPVEKWGGYYVPNTPTPATLPSSTDYHTAEAGTNIKTGYPLYLTTGGLINPAQADAPVTTQAAGVSISDTAAGSIGQYITEGRVERSDWTEVAGTLNLITGATYFLDPLVAGHITNLAPSATGHYVVRIGRAVSTELLDVEIELPIRL